MDWVEVGDLGFVNKKRILAVGAAHPAGMKRFLGATAQERIIDLTGGRKRQSLLALDSGHVVISALSVVEIGRFLEADSTQTGNVQPKAGRHKLKDGQRI